MEVVLDSYDPLLDPSYRAVANWAQSYAGLKSLSIAPLSHSAWLLFDLKTTDPVLVSHWTLVPHRDPSLQMWLASNFRMITVNLKEVDDHPLVTPFPLEKPTSICLLVTQDITIPTLVKAAKDVIRMMTGTTRKLVATMAVDTTMTNSRARLFPENMLPRDVKMREYTLEVGVQKEVKASFVTKFPTIRNLKPELGENAAPIAKAWEKLSLIVRNKATRFWHKGLLATMLSDDYWNFAVAKVAESISAQKMRTMLIPVPVTSWWFQRIVRQAVMDITALKTNASAFDETHMGRIYGSWKASTKKINSSDRRRAMDIRKRIGIPHFSAGQPEEAAQMIAKLVATTCDHMPNMLTLLKTGSKLGLDAADHPFWREILKKDLISLWPHPKSVPPSGKKGRIRMNHTFPSYLREHPAAYFKTKYVFEEVGGKLSPINEMLNSILELKSHESEVSADAVHQWLKNIDRHREEFCLPELMTGTFAGPSAATALNQMRQEDRWLLKMTYANASAHGGLEPHPWFHLIEKVALPKKMSDLAWRIPDSYWTSNNDNIEKSRAKKFKFMANKTAKCITLAVYFAQHAKAKLVEPEILEIMEFSALLSAERPFQQMKVIAYTEAGNLSLTTAEYFWNPMRRWSHLTKMTACHEVMAANGGSPAGVLTIWAHAYPGQGKMSVVFHLSPEDAELAEPKTELSHDQNQLLGTLKRKVAELNCKSGAQWQMAVRKIKWTAMKLGKHTVILASSQEAEEEVLNLATQPNGAENKEDNETRISLRETFITAMAENGKEPSNEDLAGVLMPILVSLVEENHELGTFFWKRTTLKDRQGWKSNAIIYSQIAIVAPGQLRHLRDLRDWGLAHMGGRMNSKTELERAERILCEFEKIQESGGVSRTTMGWIAVFTAEPEQIVKPSWLESVSVLGLGECPELRPFNTGPIWSLEKQKGKLRT